MLHACFVPIAICFVYTSWHFYVFSGTNLLTRYQSVSSCFMLFLCFRKVTQEILSELDETKPKVNISLSRTRGLERSQRRAREPPPHHRVARPPGRATTWCGPLRPHFLRPFAYIFSISGKLSTLDPPSMKSSSVTAVVNPRSGGFWSSSRHPAGEGIYHRRHLHHHAHLRIDAWVVHPWTMGP
jgi:hypothetical protein